MSSWRFVRDMKQLGCKLVHFHDSASLELGLTAAARAKIPLRIISRRKETEKPPGLILRPRTLQELNLIIVATSKIGRFLRERGVDPELIQTIPLGMDYAPFSVPVDRAHLRRELNLSPQDFLVGIITDLEDLHILRRVVRTADSLRRKNSRIHPVLLGEGELRLKQEDLIPGFESLKFYLGFRDSYPQILPSLDLLVFPFVIEGFEALIRDALARRVPLGLMRSESMPEDLTHRKTALLLSPQNPASLTNAVLNACENRELIRQLAENSYAMMFEKYSSEAMASRIVNEYERLARRRNISLG